MKQLDCWPQKRHAVLLAMLLILFGFGATASAEYIIGADDALQIKVYGYEDLTTETRVSAEGRITFPLIGEVVLGGDSTFAAERKISRLLSEGGFIQNAQVSVTISEYKSQQIPVLGYVNKPGLYPLESQSTVIDAIAMAEGITPLGEERAIITRHRDGKTIKQEVDLHNTLENSETNALFPIEKGDVIYIPKAPVFYIYGEVQHPGAYRLEPNMTVAQALSLSGGLTLRGTLRGIVIERRDSSGKSETVEVQLTDVVLKDNVVVVDERLF
ncbi:Polysaccharide export outer membrane protein [Candidatus Methylobacter favarea]|uniref:Polysaccharide export outer membrane protein n=1 Tax=Candidatus Methylobacter favarea TaxID=2707345 RepID=A0A8S0X391_9GAMM|nr:polysaccharide export protein EpsE [Candidatus Methylobacter favarea]CAA9892544.1 Polysaccharide export outer membrane protein [Candidatus Methylobacter favarea]